MTPRIEKAIDIFLDAINNGTLAKGTCAACAVGNLIANSIGYHIEGLGPTIMEKTSNGGYRDVLQPNAKWRGVLNGYGMRHRNELNVEMIAYIEQTGFTLEEISKIERAFEENTRIAYYSYHDCTDKLIRADQIRGLEAVIKVMLTFDDCKKDVKEVFTKRAELIPL